MRSLALLPVVLLALSSCGNKSPQKDVLDWRYRDSISHFDDSITHSEEQKASYSTAKEQEIKRNEGASTGTLPTNRVKQDNMRGFDPASEDDMDDNGMSRYMENNDEEGWD